MLSQESYIEKVLKSFGMEDSKPITTPLAPQFQLKSLTKAEPLEQAVRMEEIPYASIVGSLMYAMVVSRFMSKPGMDHWKAVKWILKYLRGESKTSLTFVKSSVCLIKGFSDSDYSADLDRRRSVTGYVFKVWGNTVSWISNLQSVVALSTIEAEYMAFSTATKEAVWLKAICEELGLQTGSVKMHFDSQSALDLAKNRVFQERTKHVANKYHFIRDIFAQDDIIVHKITQERIELIS